MSHPETARPRPSAAPGRRRRPGGPKFHHRVVVRRLDQSWVLPTRGHCPASPERLPEVGPVSPPGRVRSPDGPDGQGWRTQAELRIEHPRVPVDASSRMGLISLSSHCSLQDRSCPHLLGEKAEARSSRGSGVRKGLWALSPGLLTPAKSQSSGNWPCWAPGSQAVGRRAGLPGASLAHLPSLQAVPVFSERASAGGS